jgi:hypothetical protein
MSLTSYRAAPPRVTSVNPKGLSRYQRKSRCDLSRVASRYAACVIHVNRFSGLSCVRWAPFLEHTWFRDDWFSGSRVFLEATKAAVERPIVTRHGRFSDEKIGMLEQTPWVCSKVAFGRPGSDLLSRVLRRSTMGAGAFHGRVRKGNGCSHPAITTRSAKRNFN